jgi:hypothetical protein
MDIDAHSPSRTSIDSDEELGRYGGAHGEWEFLVGTAISVYQNSGGDHNNWSEFEKGRSRFGTPAIDVRTSHCESELPYVSHPSHPSSLETAK